MTPELLLTVSLLAVSDAEQDRVARQLAYEKQRVELLKAQVQARELQEELSGNGALPILTAVYELPGANKVAIFSVSVGMESMLIEARAGDSINNAWKVSHFEGSYVVLEGIGPFNRGSKEKVAFGGSAPATPHGAKQGQE